MNRRQFTQRLAAIAATPLIPTGTLAKAATPVATALSATSHPYNWAAFIARIHDKASPAMFKRQLSLSDDMAKQVFETLVKEKVISAPNALGISQATDPFRRNLGAIKAVQPQKAFEVELEKPKTIKSTKSKNDLEADIDEAKELEADLEPVNQEDAVSEYDQHYIQDSQDSVAEDFERPD